MTSPGSVRLFSAMSLVLLTSLGACADRMATNPSPVSLRDPVFSVYQTVAGEVWVCPNGPAGTYNYSVSAVVVPTWTAGAFTGTFSPANIAAAEANQTLIASPVYVVGTCTLVFRINAAMYFDRGDGVLIDALRAVTIQQVGAPAGTQLDKIMTQVADGPEETTLPPATTVMVSINGYHGAVASFWNSLLPPPPPGYLDVCKVGGPAGTYTFHVDVQDGGAFTLPNGSDKSVTFDGSTPSCATMYVPANYTTWPTGAEATVEITEVGIPEGIEVGSITVTLNGVTSSPITNTTSTTVSMGFTDIASVRYVNKAKERPRPLQGCTPGYWKVKKHADSWIPTGYTTSQLLSSVFNVPAAYSLRNKPLGGYTLLQGLSFQGGSTASGKAEILLRAAVAGLLNSGTGSFYYGMTTADLINGVNAALASGDLNAMTILATQIDNLNNALGGCPLN